jgi:hypothetical protein
MSRSAALPLPPQVCAWLHGCHVIEISVCFYLLYSHTRSVWPCMTLTLHALQDVTSSAYAQDIVFEDPISRFTDLGGYQFMIRALKTLFSVTFDLHDVTFSASDMVTTRWAGRQNLTNQSTGHRIRSSDLQHPARCAQVASSMVCTSCVSA